MTVADRFSEDDDVGNDAVTLKSPKMRADAAVSGLHFVGDAHSSRFTDLVIDLTEIASRQNDLPRNARHRFRDKATKSICGLDDAHYVLCIVRCTRKRNFVHPRRWTVSPWSIMFVWTQVDQRRGVAVIRVIENDHVACVCVRTRKPEREFVCLTAGVDEVTDVQRIRQR